LAKKRPPFLAPEEDTAIKKNLLRRKIATNVAGFYALDVALAGLFSQSNQAPAEWLNKIKDNTIDSATVSILNRFAMRHESRAAVSQYERLQTNFYSFNSFTG